MISVARNASRASTELTWALSAILALVQIFFDALGFAQQIRRVLIRDFHEMLERLEGLLEFIGKFFVLLVLPGIAQRGKTRLQRSHSILQIHIGPLQFI